MRVSVLFNPLYLTNMGPARKPTPERYCAYCGKKLERKDYPNSHECVPNFLKRKYCSRECMRKAFIKVESLTKTLRAHTQRLARYPLLLTARSANVRYAEEAVNVFASKCITLTRIGRIIIPTICKCYAPNAIRKFTIRNAKHRNAKYVEKNVKDCIMGCVANIICNGGEMEIRCMSRGAHTKKRNPKVRFMYMTKAEIS